MINDNDETFKHEGFGMISIGRVHCGGSGQVLYGSNVSHHEYIQLKISTGYLNRHLNRDWFHEDKTLIEINLSPVQFAEMISVGMNNGSTPCTLTWFNGKRMEEVPVVNKQMQHDEEFQHKMREVGRGLDDLTANATTILSASKPPSKGEREAILNDIRMLKQEIVSNLPWYHTQFQKEMNKTVKEAKGEVDAFVNRVITSKGLEALSAVAPKMLDDGTKIE